MQIDLANIRREYSNTDFNVEDAKESPFEQFQLWLQDAIDAKLPEPNAMALATSSPDGQPSVRIVLLKSLQSDQFVFYTNYNSRKGKELTENNKVALSFHWVELERQVRIVGIACKLQEEVSSSYFHSRPRGSQIGAWVSPQSSPIKDRAFLEGKQAFYEEKFAGKDIPKPSNWGGYGVFPSNIEFWQGRSSRLHDRVEYNLTDGGLWAKQRLAP